MAEGFPILGAGWRKTNDIQACAPFLVEELNPPGAMGVGGFVWSVLDLAARKTSVLTKLSLIEGHTAVVAQRSKTLLYPNETGIVQRAISGQAERTLVKLDRDFWSVRRLWLSADESRLYSLCRKTEKPLSSLLRRVFEKKRHGMVEIDLGRLGEKFVLLQYAFTSGRRGDMHELSAPTGHVGFSRKRECLVLASQRAIRKIDLISSKESQIAEVASPVGVCISPGDRVVVWMLRGWEIGQVSWDGQVAMWGISGYNLAFSKGDRFISYWLDDGLFLHELERGRPCAGQLVLKAPVESFPANHHQVAWCPCGKHFAVQVPAGDAAASRDRHRTTRLVIGNVATRRMLIETITVCNYLWGPPAIGA